MTASVLDGCVARLASIVIAAVIAQVAGRMALVRDCGYVRTQRQEPKDYALSQLFRKPALILRYTQAACAKGKRP